MKCGLEVGAWVDRGLIIAARGWSSLPSYWLVLSHDKRVLSVCLDPWAEIHTHWDVEGLKDVRWVGVCEVRAMSDLRALLLFSSQLLRKILGIEVVPGHLGRFVRRGCDEQLCVCLKNFVWSKDRAFWVVQYLLELNRGVFQKPVSRILLIPELVWSGTERAFWLEDI